MKNLFAMLMLFGTLVAGSATAQEHKHEEHKEEVKAPGPSDAAKPDSKKCCEGMEKAGEAKEGTPTKGDVKTKQEKMKAMKEKMAEKMKGMDGMKMKDMKSDGKPSDASKDAHQH
jgi:hypothetical protein